MAVEWFYPSENKPRPDGLYIVQYEVDYFDFNSVRLCLSECKDRRFSIQKDGWRYNVILKYCPYKQAIDRRRINGPTSQN